MSESPAKPGSPLTPAALRLLSSTKSPLPSPKGSPSNHFAAFVEQAVNSGSARERAASGDVASTVHRRSWAEELEKSVGGRKPRPSSLPRSFSSSPDVEARLRTSSVDFVRGLSEGLSSLSTSSRAVADPLVSPDGSTSPGADLKIDNTKVLGRGFFGVVYEGKLNNKRVAVKVLKRPNVENLEKELSTLREIRSTNCVLFLHYFPKKSALVMEFMGGGSLADLLHKSRSPLPKRLRLKIAMDIADGLVYLHSIPMLHRDLTSGNVLLTRRFDSIDVATLESMDEDTPVAKISDFGLARKGNQYHSMNTGNVLYVAPEVYDNTAAHSALSDVFSFGILLYELFSRRLPYQGMEPRQAANRAAERDGLRPSHVKNDAETVPDSIMRMCERSWASIVKQRPSSNEIAESLRGLLRVLSSCLIIPSTAFNPDEVLLLLKQRGLGAKVFSGNIRDVFEGIRRTNSVVIAGSKNGYAEDVICRALCESVVQAKHFVIVELDDAAPASSSTTLLKPSNGASFAESFLTAVKRSDIVKVVGWPGAGREHRDIAAEVAANHIIRVLSDNLAPADYPVDLKESAWLCSQVYDEVLR